MSSKKSKTYRNEVWEKVSTKHPTKGCDYYFSDYGRMKSVNKVSDSEKLLKGSRDKYGNVKLSLQLAKGKRQQFYLHRLIGETFIEKPTKKSTFLVHQDGNKENNFWENLVWMDQEELTEYQRELGVFNPANKKPDPNRKLNVTKVKAIKQKLKKANAKKDKIAKQYGITVAHVNMIESGKRWGYVKA